MIRSFYWYQNICPCDLGLRWNWPHRGHCVSQTHLVFSSLNQHNDIIVCVYCFELFQMWLMGLLFSFVLMFYNVKTSCRTVALRVKFLLTDRRAIVPPIVKTIYILRRKVAHGYIFIYWEKI